MRQYPGAASHTSLWLIDMLSGFTRDRATQVRRVTLAESSWWQWQDQPTVARLQAQTAAGFIGSAVCRCPPDTTGSRSLVRIRQPSVCDRSPW